MGVWRTALSRAMNSISEFICVADMCPGILNMLIAFNVV